MFWKQKLRVIQGWTPYKGQLRLQGYSHLASGSNSSNVLAGILFIILLRHTGRDFSVMTCRRMHRIAEACIMGKEFSEIGSHLVNLKKKNDVAILVSNEALTALKWFGIEATAAGNNGWIQ